MPKLPDHIAVIPDGNRRWAKAHRLNPWEGHIEGTKRYWDAANFLFELGVTNLTFWAASYDNLHKRSKMEVNFLIKLLHTEMQNPQLWELAQKNKVRVQVLGEWDSVIKNQSLREAIQDIQSRTAQFTKRTLTFLFCYDGQREMVEAVKNLAHFKQQPVTESTLRSSLWTGSLPDVDLVIRTGGEPHWSAGFMMWLTANSQFYFTDTLWPAFKKEQIKKALVDYERRERRLGK